MRHFLTVIAILLLAAPAGAADGIRHECEQYKFAFTFEDGTLLKFEQGGPGVSGEHIPPSARKADYGVLVYGHPGIHLIAAEAKATGLAEEESILTAASILDPDDWPDLYTAIMEARGLMPAGNAKIKDGERTISLPYYAWEQHVLGRTRHALMYVVKHGDAFIYVQVESSAALSKAQLEWLTRNLELL